MADNLETDPTALRLAECLVLENMWFTTKRLDAVTWAIGEPAYHQKNWSYLLCDEEEDGLLFDTGYGRRPIAPMIERYAGNKVKAFPSHMHFDHLGNIEAFKTTPVADLPATRKIANGRFVTPTEEMFLGATEGVPVPMISVSKWIQPDENIACRAARNRGFAHAGALARFCLSLGARPKKILCFRFHFCRPTICSNTWGIVNGLPDNNRTIARLTAM